MGAAHVSLGGRTTPFYLSQSLGCHYYYHHEDIDYDDDDDERIGDMNLLDQPVVVRSAEIGCCAPLLYALRVPQVVWKHLVLFVICCLLFLFCKLFFGMALCTWRGAGSLIKFVMSEHVMINICFV